MHLLIERITNWGGREWVGVREKRTQASFNCVNNLLGWLGVGRS